MDHKYIDELDLVDRYLMGRLAAEETARFEEHFVDCLQCVDRLKTTKALMAGLRFVTSNQATAAHSYGPRGPYEYMRQVISRKSFAWAAGVLLLVALAGVLVVSNRIHLSQVKADEARSAAAQWQRRYEEERQSSSLADSKHQESEHELTGQVAKLRTELENERKPKPTKLPNEYGVPKRPQINFKTFVLESTRGSKPSSDSINELNLPSSPTSFSISLVLEGEKGYDSYSMTILDGQKQPIWKGRGFKPDRYNQLSMGVNSTFFRRGDYLLELEGVAGDGSTSGVGKYSFRVLKTP